MDHDFCAAPGDGRGEFTYVQGYGFETPLRPYRNRIRIYANAIGYTLLVFLLLQNMVPYLAVRLARLAYPAVRIYNDSFLASRDLIETVNIFSTFVCYLVPLLMLQTVLRLPVRAAFPLRRAGADVALPAIGVVLGSSAIGSGAAMLLSFLLEKAGLHPSGPDFPAPESVELFLLSLVSYALLPAIFEELLFRGLILQSLRRFGDQFALVCTTLLFALLHRNLVQFPNALLTGFVLGFLALRTGSLRVVILCHFVNNGLPLLVQALTAGLPAKAGNLLYLGLEFLYVLLGLAGLLYLCCARPALFAPMAGEGHRAEWHKYRSFFSSVPMDAVLLVLVSMIVWNMLA